MKETSTKRGKKSIQHISRQVSEYLVRAQRDRRHVLKFHKEQREAITDAWGRFNTVLRMKDETQMAIALDKWVRENLSSQGRTRMLAAIRKANFAAKNLQSVAVSKSVAKALRNESKVAGKSISAFLETLLDLYKKNRETAEK